MDDVRMMTYAEAAKVMGVQVDSVKRRARNRRWKRENGNDGLVRVGVPLSAIPDCPPDHPTDNPSDNQGDIIRLEKQVSALQTEVRLLRERETDLKADRDAWKVLVERRRIWWPFSRR